MNDYINRKQAIERASGYCHPANIIDELKRMPGIMIPSWIPTEAGLPGVYIDVLVSSKRGVQVMHMTPGGYWTDGAQLDAPGYVEAWMPLPEPWKGGTE